MACPLNLAITGVGMVSSLGLDVATCCAAARAGIVRARELDLFPVGVLVDGSIQGVLAHQVPMLTEGFEGDPRLLRLLQGALEDLKRKVSHAPWDAVNTGFYLSLPDPRRSHFGIELIPDEEERKAKASEAAERFEEPVDGGSQLRLLRNAARLAGWAEDPHLRYISMAGHAGVAEAIVEAVKDLSAGVVGAAVVGGADSLLDEDTLAWLGNTFRLKTPENPMGLQPGEAGAFFVIENASDANAHRGRPLGFVRAVSMGKETKTLLLGERSPGVALTDTILAATEAGGGAAKASPAWIVTDQNGENYRGAEWGHAAMLLAMRSPAFGRTEVWYPASSYGDTGAASGAVALCMVIRAFSRNYAQGDSALLVSSSDGDLRAALFLSRN
jgi:3-oxoacyl-[acyl-carrier-protein] synthase-1